MPKYPDPCSFVPEAEERCLNIECRYHLVKNFKGWKNGDENQRRYVLYSIPYVCVLDAVSKGVTYGLEEIVKITGLTHGEVELSERTGTRKLKMSRRIRDYRNV